MKKLFPIILLLGFLLLPLITGAGEYKADGQTVTYEGLVPCGKTVKVDGTEMTVPCQLCHLFVMLKGIIDFFLLPPDGVIFLVAVFMIVVSGIMFLIAYVMSPGNPKLISQAQKTITATIIGLAIMFSAWILVNTFFLLIGVADWTSLRQGWFIIECDVRLPETYLPNEGLIVKTDKGQNSLGAGINQEFEINIGFVPQHPVSNIDISLSFNNDLLVLKKITPNISFSNFKMFLPANENLGFDQEAVITKANNDGIIIVSAACFDAQSGKSLEQTEPINSLLSLIFKTKKTGIAEIKTDTKDSRFVAAIGNIANVLEKENNKIEIIIQ